MKSERKNIMTDNVDRFEKIVNYESQYCYPGTDILINKFDIRDRVLLEEIERDYSTYRLSKIYLKDFSGNFDMQHYLDIHKYVFGDLYDFAGEIRNENIRKGGVPFCRPEFIAQNLKYILLKMKRDLIKINDEKELLEYLAYYYGEINIIHPFREGNGRVQREFFRQYMQYINERKPEFNYALEYSRWSNVDKQKLIKGCIVNAMTGDTTLLKEVLAKALVNVNEKEMKKTR